MKTKLGASSLARAQRPAYHRYQEINLEAMEGGGVFDRAPSEASGTDGMKSEAPQRRDYWDTWNDTVPGDFAVALPASRADFF